MLDCQIHKPTPLISTSLHLGHTMALDGNCKVEHVYTAFIRLLGYVTVSSD